jgi:hypothetical protein
VNADNFGRGEDMHLTLDRYLDELAKIIIEESAKRN